MNEKNRDLEVFAETYSPHRLVETELMLKSGGGGAPTASELRLSCALIRAIRYVHVPVLRPGESGLESQRDIDVRLLPLSHL